MTQIFNLLKNSEQPKISPLPEPFVGESMSGAGFEIMFKFNCL